MSNRILSPKVMVVFFTPLLAASSGPLAAAESTVEVRIMGFAFEPQTVEVSPGDTVTWVNKDTAPHTATLRKGGWDLAASGRARPTR